MAQQTAVEWLNHELWSLRLQLRGGEISIEDFGKKMVVRLDQAKQMEKEQIVNAYKAKTGSNPRYPTIQEFFDKQADHYYNETYGK